VFAVDPGGLPNTIYLGYGPTSLTLTVIPSGGTAPYHFSWSTGGATASTVVSPSVPGSYNYSVTVTDAAGCSAEFSTSVKVIDVRCGNKMDKVIVCHIPPGNPGNVHEICISKNAVPAHLSEHGDMLGACMNETNEFTRTVKVLPEDPAVMGVLPNPSRGQFELKIAGSGKAEISVFNANGRLFQ
jgi:hypothetical protein